MRLRVLTIVAPHLFDVNYNATLRSAGSSMRVGPVDAGVANGPLVAVVNADDASREAVTDAAFLWNQYHPDYSGPAAKVIGHVVPNWNNFDTAGPDTIGLAQCYECPNYYPRLCCGITNLYVINTAAALMFDVFVHEIAHAVLPAAATSYAGDRQLRPEHHHWDPPQPGEVFGPYISASPHLAVFTVAAADAAATAACAADLPCSHPLRCVRIDGFQRVPQRCALNGTAAVAGGAPVDAQAANAAATVNGDGDIGSLAVWLVLGAALVLVAGVVAVAFADTDSDDHSAAGAFL